MISKLSTFTYKSGGERETNFLPEGIAGVMKNSREMMSGANLKKISLPKNGRHVFVEKLAKSG